MTGTVTLGDAGVKAVFSTALRLLVSFSGGIGREYEANHLLSKMINLSRFDKLYLSN